MEPITLLTATIALISPFIYKTGEKIAEEAGEDIWEWLKKHCGGKKEIFKDNIVSKETINIEKVKQVLREKINRDNEFKKNLEEIINQKQTTLNSQFQQNIHNNGNIEKQLNLTNNSGTINFS